MPDPRNPNLAAHPSSPSPPDPDGRQAARALVSYSPSLAQPLSASPAPRFWESQPVIRALIRQDFLPATARGGGGAGEKQGQPKVKFHSQGLKEPPPPPTGRCPLEASSTPLQPSGCYVRTLRPREGRESGQPEHHWKNTIPALPWARVPQP